MIKFEVGRTYTTGFAGYSGIILTMKVVKRTAKTIQVIEDGKLRTFRIKYYPVKDCEFVTDGNYSMAYSYTADREA